MLTPWSHIIIIIVTNVQILGGYFLFNPCFITVPQRIMSRQALWHALPNVLKEKVPGLSSSVRACATLADKWAPGLKFSARAVSSSKANPSYSDSSILFASVHPLRPMKISIHQNRNSRLRLQVYRSVITAATRTDTQFMGWARRKHWQLNATAHRTSNPEYLHILPLLCYYILAQGFK